MYPRPTIYDVCANILSKMSNIYKKISDFPLIDYVLKNKWQNNKWEGAVHALILPKQVP